MPVHSVSVVCVAVMLMFCDCGDDVDDDDDTYNLLFTGGNEMSEAKAQRILAYGYDFDYMDSHCHKVLAS